MKSHTKVYFKFFNLDEFDFIECANCQKQAVDIHHIEPKGMGGSKEKDNIENLIALCRKCHELAHSNYFSKNDLRLMQKYKMLNK